MQLYNYASMYMHMHICTYAHNPFMQVWKGESIQASNCSSLQVSKWATFKLCKFARIAVFNYACLHVCMYAHIKVCTLLPSATVVRLVIFLKNHIPIA